MARRDDSTSTSFEEQLKQLDEMNARAMVNQMNRNERNFSTMLDRQQEMLTNFYKASTEAGRESVRSDMENRQQKMKEQLDAMKRSYALYSQYMTKTEKQTFQNLYSASKQGMDKIDKEMQKRFDGLEDDFDELTESFSDKINRISDELRDLGTALNIDAITQSLEESVDSYFENLRQVRSRTGDSFDESAFQESVDSLNDTIGAINRSQASETVSNIIKDFGMKKMNEVVNYAQTMASAEVLGISKDEMSNIMWKDMAMGKNGKFLRNISNLAITLEDNEDLYVHADTILTAINENMDAIYGLSYKDSKKSTKMVNSLAALEALSENEANEGVDTMVDMLQSWQKLTLPELMENDQALQFSNMLGMSVSQLEESLQDPDLLGSMLETFQDKLSSMNDYELNMWKEELGFDYVYQLKDIAGADSLISDYNNIVDTLDDSLNASESDATLDLMTESANETVTAIQDLKNSLSSNPVVTFFSKITDTLDISLADAANAAIVGSTLIKGGSAVVKFFKGASASGGILSTVKGLFTGGSAAAEAGSAASTAASTAASAGSTLAEGAAASGAAGGSSILSGLGASLSSAGSSMMAGTALETGGLALAGTAALGLAGAGLTLKDAVGGYKKSNEWLGDEGNLTSGKITSTIGGAIGGTGAGVGEGSALDVAKNTGGNALKGAALGAAVGSIIPGLGTAIGAAVGGGIGAVTGLIGGERIAKAAQATWDFAKDCASEAFNTVGAGVEAVNGVLQELGPVGQELGGVLTGSWDAITDTKDQIAEVWADPDKGLPAKIGGSISAVFSGAGGVAKSVIKGVKGIASKAWNGITNVATKAWDGIKNAGKSIWTSVKNTASSIWEGVQETASGIWGEVKDTAGDVWTGFQEGVTTFSEASATLLEAGGSLLEGAGALAEGVGALAEGIGTGVGNAASGVGEGIGSALGGTLSGLGDGVGNALGGIGDFLFGSDSDTTSVDLSGIQDSLTGDPVLDRLDYMLAYLKVIAENGTGASSSSDTDSDDDRWESRSGGFVGGVLNTAADLYDGAKAVGSDVISAAGDGISWAANGIASGVSSFVDWINPFANGLSEVPNDGLAYLHQGEAILTSDQADVVRASADGGIDVLKSVLTNTGEDFELTTTNSYLSSMSSGLTGFMSDEMSGKKNSLKDSIKTSSNTEQEWFSLWKEQTNLDVSTTQSFVDSVKKNGIFGKSSSSSNSLISRISSALGLSSSSNSYTTAAQGTTTISTGGSSNNAGSSSLDATATSTNASANESSIYKYLTGTMGLNKAAACGVLGNIKQESSFNPNALGDNGTSYGICQWHNGRWTNLKNYCSKNNLDSTTLDGQLKYLEYELKNSYPGVYSTLKSVDNTAQGAYDAAYKWCTDFEIPANKYAEAVNRGNSAKQYFSNYGGSYDVGTPWIPNDQVALVHEGEMIVPADVNPLNNTTVSVPLSSESGSDNSDVVETLKWAVSRLEAKLDKIASSSGRTRKTITSEDVDMAYSF
jgi:hypothetical protein